MFWLIVLIILILIIHSMMKATTGVAKAVGKGVAHDMSQINAELTNKTTITNYLDYLVNCKGWKKSGTLLVMYEAPNGKTGSYIQWERRIMANHKATDDAMDESQRHIVANGYQAPCSGYFGQMTRCNGDTAFYNFYCDDGSIVENVQVSISNFGKVDNVRYDNIGFIFWSIEALNRDGQWETVGYATTAVVGGDVVKYIETVGFATARYNDENPWAILETFDAV